MNEKGRVGGGSKIATLASPAMRASRYGRHSSLMVTWSDEQWVIVSSLIAASVPLKGT